MQKNNKKIVLRVVGVIAVLGLIGGGAYYYQSATPYPQGTILHLEKATATLDASHDCKAFLENKQALINFYTSGTYDEEVKSITKKARSYFASVPAKDNSLIIIDVDDTALYHYHTSFEFRFIWKHQPDLEQLRQPGKAPAIKPVLSLYKFLVDKGFKIIFLTARYEAQRNFTLYELKRAGYTVFEDLIMMPNKLAFDPKVKAADWKTGVRKKLAETYDIVGNIGDRDADFKGNYNGHVVKLPNYLY